MPQRPFSRAQVFLIPPSLDDWLPADHPARFVAVWLDDLTAAEWAELGIDPQPARTGEKRYAPEALLAIWVDGFMTGIRSTRGLEAACRDQVPFRWLSGDQQPDHNTLARFYQRHRGAAAPPRSAQHPDRGPRRAGGLGVAGRGWHEDRRQRRR